jgi:hypothetical protein
VALQDHLVKSLSLQDPFKTKVNHKPKSNTKQTKTATRKTKTDVDDNKEYVLDAKPKPLTLGTNEIILLMYGMWVLLSLCSRWGQPTIKRNSYYCA